MYGMYEKESQRMANKTTRRNQNKYKRKIHNTNIQRRSIKRTKRKRKRNRKRHSNKSNEKIPRKMEKKIQKVSKTLVLHGARTQRNRKNTPTRNIMDRRKPHNN